VDSAGVIGIVAGVFTSIFLLPQLIKIVKEKKVEELSMSMFISLLIGLSLWVCYGMLRKDMPIIVTNGFSVLENICILFFRFKYRKNN
jgi:MtN3 and saliva related transmembrane protein